MYVSILLLAGCVVGGCYAQVLFSGKCPTPTLQADFDANRYTGKWYEMENYFAVFQIGGRCVTADYTLQGDGSILVNNTAYYPLMNSYSSVIGDAVGTDPTNAAKLGVRFSRFQPRGDYWVVSTDYDTYSVVWSCVESSIPFVKFHWNAQLLWILTRAREGIPSGTRDIIFSMLQGYGINTDKLHPTDQTNCP